jgi:hypothetical protein
MIKSPSHRRIILNLFLGFISLLILPSLVLGQKNNSKKFLVYGRIISSLDSTGLGGTSIRVLENKSGVVSDEKGNYNLFLSPGTYTLEFQFLGYEKEIRKVTIKSNLVLNISLLEHFNTELGITVKSKRGSNQVKNFEMGVQRLEMKTIKKLPSLLGETDILRTVLSLPGISTVGEGATGFNVRGGGIDENLILMDAQEVYNSSHLFGFFSVYNPEAVDDATLIKGGIPAQYGGRLSSILDVHMLSGNPESISGSGGIGTVSTRLALGGPLQKDKSEFFITGRRSYADLFLKLSNDPTTRATYAYFYDLNTKFNFHLNPRDELEVSGYYGKDVVNLAGVIGFQYGNGLGGIGWKHKYESGLKSSLNIGFSNYDNSLGIPSGINGFNYKNQITNYQAKLDFETRQDSILRFKYGFSLIRYQIQPGTTQPIGDSSFLNPFSVSHQRAYEYGTYIQVEQKLSSSFSAQYGLRFSAFDYRSAGLDTVYSYSGIVGQPLNPVNPKIYSMGSSIKTYFNLEPRISVRFLLNAENSLKASYGRTTQYIHLISNTTASSPFDIWATTSNNIPPERADQFSLGYFKNLSGNRYEASAEVYYKTTQNEIDYVNGAQTLLNKNLEGELLYGIGKSYGLELYIKKNTGRLNGWLSYTLSKTERKIPGINNDSWYPSKYDRTHNLSLVGTYEYSPRLNFSANFTYQSGIHTTFPDSRFSFEGLVVPYNSGNNRNNYILPSYNRLDLSATLYNKRKPGRKFHSNWVFTLYNVYRRRNAYSIYFRQDPNDPNKTEAVRLSILGSAIPGVTWNFDF